MNVTTRDHQLLPLPARSWMLLLLSCLYVAITPVAALAMPNQIVHSTMTELSSKVTAPLASMLPSGQFFTTDTTKMMTPPPTLSSDLLLSSLGIDINWDNPGQAFGTVVFLAYIGISVAAGLKYIIIDGWRPKL
jgi:hypothetical protein